MRNKDSQPAPPPPPQGALARVLSPQMVIYYANCAMVATSPRDVSLFFGRLMPTQDEQGGQRLAEMYERQVYMTVEQAEDLARILAQTLERYRMMKIPKEPDA
ncbi:MAG: DUF3467 domain-containing protein [Deltaproteobacteria bacterium]|nr:DUF3467 domain-containing protein [Deltaproteobacteria bacterium]